MPNKKGADGQFENNIKPRGGGEIYSDRRKRLTYNEGENQTFQTADPWL